MDNQEGANRNADDPNLKSPAVEPGEDDAAAEDEGMGPLLTSERMIRWGRAGFIAVLAVWFVTQVLAPGPLDIFGRPMAPDLAGFYVAGRMVSQGRAASLYDGPVFFEESRHVLGFKDPAGFEFLYPPFVAVLCVPLSWLPFQVLAWLYLMASVGLGLGLGWRIGSHYLGETQEARAACWLFAASPPFLQCILYGQNGLLTLAILWEVWRMFADGRPERASVWMGLGCWKPQLWLPLWGAAVLLWGWRLWPGVLVIVAMISLSLPFGMESWVAWLDTVRHHIPDPATLFRQHSLMNGCELLGLNTTFARGASAALLLFWICVMGRCVWNKLRDTPSDFFNSNRGAIACFALLSGVLIIPRVFQYDLVIFYPVMIAAWVTCTGTVRGYRAVMATLVVIWLGDTSSLLHIPFLTIAMLAWAVWLGRKLVLSRHASLLPGSEECVSGASTIKA
ncbi:MAG: glycosyltransferase family 87 protein [Candidatus Methylacidiphilales bacterium]|nr:glycosyltransferase family 87 protein [Candidatus Methylacidiphilales bacterium]